MKNASEPDVRLCDAELLNEVKRLTADEQRATARLIAALGELDVRRLYLGEGCSSLFTYCTQVLHLSEHATYLRIEAARAARKWPEIVELLADGALHLTAISLLAPHLAVHNHARVLAAARHKTKRELEELVAALRPLPAVPSSVRKLPAPKSPTVQAVVTTPLVTETSRLPVPFIDSNVETAQAVLETRKEMAAVKPWRARQHRPTRSRPSWIIGRSAASAPRIDADSGGPASTSVLV